MNFRLVDFVFVVFELSVGQSRQFSCEVGFLIYEIAGLVFSVFSFSCCLCFLDLSLLF